MPAMSRAFGVLRVRARRPLPSRPVAAMLLVATLLPGVSAGQERDTSQSISRDFSTSNLCDDLKAYIVAPLHWRGQEWLQFGGAVLATGAAYHFDRDVRDHFVDVLGEAPADPESHDFEDALPAAIVLGGSWLYATLTDDSGGQRDSKTMLEAAVFSAATSTVLKHAFGRERPNSSTQHDDWWSGGDAFPSTHVTAAFAIGTVLAESGDDRHRWLRRALGYGIAAGTAWQRLNHNVHWLSDTVAGASLGVAAARFVMQRHGGRTDHANLQILPLDGGLMLSYNLSFVR